MAMHDRLKEARMLAGFETGREAAEYMRVAPSTYAAHESGKRSLKPDVAERYARAFRVSKEWLFLGIGAARGAAPETQEDTFTESLIREAAETFFEAVPRDFYANATANDFAAGIVTCCKILQSHPGSVDSIGDVIYLFSKERAR